MVVTKMKWAKIKCRECDFWSLTCGIKKKIRGYKTIHTLTKRIKDRTNDNANNNNSIRQGEKKSKDIEIKQAKIDISI